MNEEERLVKILQLSHSQILAGKSFSQEEAERFLDDRLYEFRDKMVSYSTFSRAFTERMGQNVTAWMGQSAELN